MTFKNTIVNTLPIGIVGAATLYNPVLGLGLMASFYLTKALTKQDRPDSGGIVGSVMAVGLMAGATSWTPFAFGWMICDSIKASVKNKNFFGASQVEDSQNSNGNDADSDNRGTSNKRKIKM